MEVRELGTHYLTLKPCYPDINYPCKECLINCHSFGLINSILNRQLFDNQLIVNITKLNGRVLQKGQMYLNELI